jgi:Leucine-rich repeat (LRR) protein
MDFSKCEFLEIIPNVSRIPNLEKLILNDCTKLVEIHHSVGFLDKLVLLNLEDCYNLSSFPKSLKLSSLEYLSVRGCSSLNDFPEIDCEMEKLQTVDFGGTGIKELPSSIRYLTGLISLNLNSCKNLTNLSSSIYLLPHLQDLCLDNCTKLVF